MSRGTRGLHFELIGALRNTSRTSFGYSARRSSSRPERARQKLHSKSLATTIVIRAWAGPFEGRPSKRDM